MLLCWWVFTSHANALELHTKHCLFGCPTGAPSSNDYIVRDNYTMSSNDFTKFADWVAYSVTRDTIGSGCSRNWRVDPSLAAEETLEPEDYRGAHNTLSTDRGHQVPLASFCGTDSWRETNYLSNITPQRSELNQGPWKHLEEKVRDLAERGGSIYVLSGPLYNKHMPSLPSADEFHVVPSGYWKVIATYDGLNLKTASFMFDQDTPRQADYCTNQTTLAVIQTKSRLRLYPEKAYEWLLSSSRIPGLCSPG